MLPRPAVAALLLALALVLTACAGPGTPTTASTTGEVRTDSLAEATVLETPKEHVGAEVAVLADRPIAPPAEPVEPQLPATVVDNQGTEVTITDTSRVLALDLNGTLGRLVAELGMLDSLAGRDTSTTFPEARDLPLVTRAGHDLSAEAILEVQPTLIITDTSLGPWNVLLQMREAGIPVVVVDSARSTENVAELAEQVGAALGVPEEGKTLGARLTTEVEDIRTQIAAIAPRELTDKLRAVFLYVRGQAGVYQMLGAGTGADSLIEALGLYDISAEIGWSGARPLNDEGLLAAQPDVVLTMAKGLESVGGVDGLLDRYPALADTPAGRNRRIVAMNDADILGFGPRTADVLEALALAIYAPADAP